ncbi:leucine-rich repeat extensin-like protein 3 [Iris pallida]|uniref:Leucine-rich repeat extensin-like protein 3 n=1 Tax=Iris pallida TaxID=29817 RepID=A0AAX6FH25_IRIPA|nr:leucine-rich repeat extensin-like protein 3 [Iris pallida]
MAVGFSAGMAAKGVSPRWMGGGVPTEGAEEKDLTGRADSGTSVRRMERAARMASMLVSRRRSSGGSAELDSRRPSESGRRKTEVGRRSERVWADAALGLRYGRRADRWANGGAQFFPVRPAAGSTSGSPGLEVGSSGEDRRFGKAERLRWALGSGTVADRTPGEVLTSSFYFFWVMVVECRGFPAEGRRLLWSPAMEGSVVVM